MHAISAAVRERRDNIVVIRARGSNFTIFKSRRLRTIDAARNVMPRRRTACESNQGRRETLMYRRSGRGTAMSVEKRPRRDPFPYQSFTKVGGNSKFTQRRTWRVPCSGWGRPVRSHRAAQTIRLLAHCPRARALYGAVLDVRSREPGRSPDTWKTHSSHTPQVCCVNHWCCGSARALRPGTIARQASAIDQKPSHRLGQGAVVSKDNEKNLSRRRPRSRRTHQDSAAL